MFSPKKRERCSGIRLTEYCDNCSGRSLSTSSTVVMAVQLPTLLISWAAMKGKRLKLTDLCCFLKSHGLWQLPASWASLNFFRRLQSEPKVPRLEQRGWVVERDIGVSAWRSARQHFRATHFRTRDCACITYTRSICASAEPARNFFTAHWRQLLSHSAN